MIPSAEEFVDERAEACWKYNHRIIKARDNQFIARLEELRKCYVELEQNSLKFETNCFAAAYHGFQSVLADLIKELKGGA